jgi:cytochrome c biogenesis protein CcmG, thiol:disulfide interchange protein DsbE
MRRLIFVIPVALFAVLAGFFYVGLFHGGPAVLPSPFIGKPAPEFQSIALDGETPPFSYDDLVAGQPTIVNFWGSWCPPCRLEAPVLNALAQRPGVRLYSFVYKDDPRKARAFLNELGNPFAKINNDPDGRIGIDWGITGAPETFVIDGKGIVRAKYVGPLTDEVVRDVILPALRG